MTTGLAAKIEQLHRSFRAANLPHAFGGALALAFCVAEPRATKDIDLNVFIGVDRIDELIDALPERVVVTDAEPSATPPRRADSRLVGPHTRRPLRLEPSLP